MSWSEVFLITKCLPFDEGILLYEDQTLNPQEPKQNQECKIHIREQAVAYKKPFRIFITP